MALKIAAIAGLAALACAHPHHGKVNNAVTTSSKSPSVELRNPLFSFPSLSMLALDDDRNFAVMSTASVTDSQSTSTETIIFTRSGDVAVRETRDGFCNLTIVDTNGFESTEMIPTLIDPKLVKYLKAAIGDDSVALEHSLMATEISVMPTESCVFTLQGSLATSTLTIPASIGLKELQATFRANLPQRRTPVPQETQAPLMSTMSAMMLSELTSASSASDSSPVTTDSGSLDVIEVHYHIGNGVVVTKTMVEMVTAVRNDDMSDEHTSPQTSMLANHQSEGQSGKDDDDFLRMEAAFFSLMTSSPQTTAAPDLFDAINHVVLGDISSTFKDEAEAQAQSAPKGMFDPTAEAKTTSVLTLHYPTSTDTIQHFAVNGGKPETRVTTTVVPGDKVEVHVYSLADGSSLTTTTTITGGNGEPTPVNEMPASAIQTGAASRPTKAAAAIIIAAVAMGAAVFA